ncbi:MAG: hypothetical protein ABSD73_12220 [Candidatus Bathyarchaeia archaeon]
MKNKMDRVIKKGKVVASAQNLEVVMRYHRQKSSIKNITAKGYYLYVLYSDGARLKTKFADPKVLNDWVHKKRRYLGLPYDKEKIMKW